MGAFEQAVFILRLAGANAVLVGSAIAAGKAGASALRAEMFDGIGAAGNGIGTGVRHGLELLWAGAAHWIVALHNRRDAIARRDAAALWRLAAGERDERKRNGKQT